MTDLDPALEAWVAEVTDAVRLSVHRGVGGASRAGHAIDAELPDGTVAELWLRSDPGFGPQSATLYSLPREAAVYRALGPTPVRVAPLVAVHPTEPAFLMQRVAGASRFAQIADAEEQLAIAQQFMAQLAELHHLDPGALDLPELGPVRTVRDHVLDELAEWGQQYDTAGGGVPVITLAFAWLREHLPGDGDWPVVLVQGDTGPGNFMYADGELVAITDWELAHWGDVHDDLAWILVRDTLERFPELGARLRDYEECSGFCIDAERLAYFRVLAQLRATIGTLAGLRSHDARGEIAWQMIYNTLHTRVLGESLAAAAGIPLPPPVLDASVDGPRAWAFDVALDDLRDVVVPALDDPFAATRAKGLARVLKYLRAVDGLGAGFDDAERSELAALLGTPVDDLDRARRALCDRLAAGTIASGRVLPYCLAQAARDTALMRDAMGVLADRHVTPVDHLLGEHDHMTEPHTGEQPVEQPDDWGLVPSDDQFHLPESDDPWWTETVWFSWSVPERNLLGYFYPAFRANLGIQFGGLLVVDDTAVVPWELPVYNWSWHEPLTAPPNLLDAHDLPEGMFLQCHEFGRTYRFGAENDEMSLDVTFESLCPPLLTRGEPPFDFGAHVDQPGRVTGSFTLHGEAMDVDCIAMRDRSWGIRRPHRQPKIGYDHATASADDGFLSISVDRKGDDRVLRGYLLRDGVWSPLVDGTRAVERDAECRPAHITVDAVDELGRELHAVGEPASRCVFNSYPHMFNWTSFTRWEFDGVQAWGEDQDVWHPGKWRRFVLEQRSGA